LGFGLGAYAHSSQQPFLLAAAGHLEPIGQLWLNALKVAVVPMVVALLIVGIATLPSGKELGRWGGLSMATFIVMLLTGVATALGAASLFVSLLKPERVELPAAAATKASEGAASIGDWIANLIPGNLIEAMSKGDLLPVAIVSALFALALRKLSQEKRGPVINLATSARDLILVYVGWVIALLPIGGFAMAYSFAAKTGSDVIRSTIQFILYGYVLMILFALLLYIAVALIGRIKPAVFAKAAFPSQLVAVGTRSSLASLPAMIQSANAMKLPEPAVDVVLPMAVSLFKLNRSLTSTSKLIFFAAVFGVALGPQAVFAYVVTVLLVSLSTPGLPTGAGASNFGAYMAAGLPPEGYMLIEAVNPILDPMNTILNVTGDLAAAAIVSRLATRNAAEG
jgi:proton glutamate symport protein